MLEVTATGAAVDPVSTIGEPPLDFLAELVAMTRVYLKKLCGYSARSVHLAKGLMAYMRFLKQYKKKEN